MVHTVRPGTASHVRTPASRAYSVPYNYAQIDTWHARVAAALAGRFCARRQSGVIGQRQGAHRQRGLKPRARSIRVVRLGTRHSRRMAYLLAQPRRLGRSYQNRLATAARLHGGGHRMDHAPQLRSRAFGQLWVRQARSASGADYRTARAEAGRTHRSHGEGQLAGVLRCVHSRNGRPHTTNAGERSSGWRRCEGCGAFQRGTQRAAEPRAGAHERAC